MRASDLAGSAVGGLWKQKARTALTLAGVAVGTCALAFSLSLGIGLRALIDREFTARPAFWVVHVRSSDRGPPVPEADIPPAELAVDAAVAGPRRDRLHRYLVEKYQNEHPRRPPVRLTPDTVAALRGLPDVTDVDVWMSGPGRVTLAGCDRVRDATVATGELDRDGVRDRLTAGRLPAPDADEVLVSEHLLYELGARTDADFESAVGRTLRVTLGVGTPPRHLALAQALGLRATAVSSQQEEVLAKVAAGLPGALDRLDLTPAEREQLLRLLADRAALVQSKGVESSVGEVRVVGVVRGLDRKEFEDPERPDPWELRAAGVLFPPGGGQRLFGRMTWVQEVGPSAAEVRVRPGGDLRGTVAAVDAMGVDQYSALKWFDASKRQVTLISAGLNLFAWASLVIAGLGITNTLVTTVLERTKEIGIYKALGATDRQVMAVFLTEGAVLGVIGGLLGVLLAFLLSVPGDGMIRDLVQEQSREQLISRTVFDFPLWVVSASVGFAAAVTTLAAVYPARRAARIEVVDALRHE